MEQSDGERGAKRRRDPRGRKGLPARFTRTEALCPRRGAPTGGGSERGIREQSDRSDRAKRTDNRRGHQGDTPPQMRCPSLPPCGRVAKGGANSTSEARCQMWAPSGSLHGASRYGACLRSRWRRCGGAENNIAQTWFFFYLIYNHSILSKI